MKEAKDLFGQYRNLTADHRTTETEMPPAENDTWDGMSYRPKADCPRCKGYGFVHPQDMAGRPVFRELVPCPEPDCMKDSVAAYQASVARAAECALTNPGQTFDSFRILRGKNDDVCRRVKSWAEDEGDYVWVVVYGGTGNGKSHLCNAALKRLIERGVPVHSMTASTFLQRLRLAMAEHQMDALMQECQTIAAFILDDLGTGMKRPDDPAGEWEWARIEELLVSRYDTRRRTMIVTNLDPADMPDRIASRMKDWRLVRMALNMGPDMREAR